MSTFMLFPPSFRITTSPEFKGTVMVAFEPNDTVVAIWRPSTFISLLSSYRSGYTHPFEVWRIGDGPEGRKSQKMHLAMLC